tara:strand:+ start:139 stop:600 length:462 start_codon:yes stop_codon:yes gene_type:complete
MREQLVTFKTANLAKEKSYKGGSSNIFILHHSTYEYDGDPNHRESYKEGDLTADSKFYMVNGEFNLGDLSNEYYTLYERPTQSLLQRWLREVYNVHIQIQVLGQFVDGENKFYCQVVEFGKNKWISKFVSSKLKYSYEEALEKGLQEALKLIK